MRKAFLVSVVTVTAALIVLPTVSFAGGGPRDHLGLFLRMTLGGMYASSGDDDVDISGWGGDFTIALGGCVSENVALHGTIFSWALSDPDVEIAGLGEGQLDGSYSMSAYGGGVTYYFMPANVYLSASVGLGFLTLDTDFGDETSDPGFALDLSVAKEWWVGNSWGLGLAGVFGYHSIEDVGGYEAGIRFSATFN